MCAAEASGKRPRHPPLLESRCRARANLLASYTRSIDLFSYSSGYLVLYKRAEIHSYLEVPRNYYCSTEAPAHDSASDQCRKVTRCDSFSELPGFLLEVGTSSEVMTFVKRRRKKRMDRFTARVVPRRDRVACLRAFVLEHFDLGYLKSGPILDVAGGKGDLSWIMRNADGLDAVIIDPRRTNHSKLERTALWYTQHPAEREVQAHAGQALAALALAPPFVAPRHIRVFLDAEFLAALVHDSTSATFTGWWARAGRRAEAGEGTKGHHQPIKCTSAEPVGRVADAVEAHNILTNARLILGFHPDEATEPCIDLALATKTPFVVCPCCVFPRQFPQRRLDEHAVSSYGDFLRYLRKKHPRMRMGKLHFESKTTGSGRGQARNTVLYMLRNDFAGAPGSSEQGGPSRKRAKGVEST